MKNNVFLLTILIFYTLSFCSNVYAHDGVIHFRGSIVEPPCISNVNGNKFSFNCYDSIGNKYKETTFKINEMKDIKKIPINEGYIVLKNIQKNMFQITISYN